MKENARQGFWNGAMAPLGYKVIEAEKRGSKIKKKLDIDPVEAETVRLIFNLYLNGDGESGALGVKEIVKWLNARGYRTRRGQTFSVGGVHKLLTNTIYIGRWKFNQTASRTRDKKADEEVVEIAVAAIIQLHVFEQVQRQLHARNPKVVAPRVYHWSNPSDRIGGVRQLRRRNDAAHWYLQKRACVSLLHLLKLRDQGQDSLQGKAIPMDKLDALVTHHLIERLFEPERLAEMLHSLSARRAEKEVTLNSRVMALQREVTNAEEKLKRLYRLVEDGVTDLDEVLKDRLNTSRLAVIGRRLPWNGPRSIWRPRSKSTQR